VFILAHNFEIHWLACLAADDGELLWTVPLELGELAPQTATVGMRAKGDGVMIAVYGIGPEGEWDWAGVIAIAVSGHSEQSIVGKRELIVPGVSTVEPAANGRVWLAGRYNDGTEDTWVTSVGLR
jgi:hypothetical protein